MHSLVFHIHSRTVASFLTRPLLSRPTQEYNAALARAKANPEEKVAIPPFDPDMYLDGGLKRVFSAGRYDILKVEGYSYQPT